MDPVESAVHVVTSLGSDFTVRSTYCYASVVHIRSGVWILHSFFWVLVSQNRNEFLLCLHASCVLHCHFLPYHQGIALVRQRCTPRWTAMLRRVGHDVVPWGYLEHEDAGVAYALEVDSITIGRGGPGVDIVSGWSSCLGSAHHHTTTVVRAYMRLRCAGGCRHCGGSDVARSRRFRR